MHRELRPQVSPRPTSQELVARPNFYVHVPSKTDPSAAPPGGGESIMVLLPVANLQEAGRPTGSGRRTEEEAAGEHAGSYQALIDAGRELVLGFFERAGIADLRADIVEEARERPL